MTSFNQYAASQSYVYGSAAEALESGRYLSPVTVPNQINGAGNARFQVVEFQPEITGGTKVGGGLVDFVKGTGRCDTFVYGSAIALSGVEVLCGIIAGLGFSIAAYEFNKDFWVDVSNNAFQNFPGYTPVTYDNIEEMSIIGMFKDNKTYLPYEVVQAVNDYLISIGAYEESYEIEVDRPTEPGIYSVYSSDVTQSNIRAILTDGISSMPTDEVFTNFAKIQLLGLIPKFMETLPSSLAGYTSFAFQWGSTGKPASLSDHATSGITMYLFTRNIPVIANISASSIHETYTSLGYAPASYMYQITCSGPAGEPTSYSPSSGSSSYSYETPIGLWKYSNYNYRTSSFGKSVIEIPRVPELTPLPGAVVSPTPGGIPLELPDWWANILEINNPEPDSKTQLMPVSVPEIDPRIYPYPVTTPQTTPQSGIVPTDNPKPVEDGPTATFEPKGGIPQPTNPTPTPTPTPVIPVIPAIGGQANKLFTVYNPSQVNLNSLGSVLWSQNVIQQIMQMFTNNPLDAVISLHILYATPTTGANKEIKLGYVSTNVVCPEVTDQYVNLSCGSVRVAEMFGDARDYANTDISIYLPMVGFRQLKTEDVMGSVVSVDYKIDVFTGTVLAIVTITKAGVNQTFYTYEGNCAVNLPLTGADKSRQLATAVGVIGSVITQNPVMGMASATAIAGGSARSQIQRSGNFTGNAGAMGCKKPYIIVSSDVPYDAVGYNAMYGLPANLTVMLGTCSGYVKVKEVHADTIANATEQEKREIESQLKQGVIIH